MAVSDQPKTVYSDSTPQKRAITDYISLIDPDDVPMVSLFGLAGDPGKFRIVNWPHYKVEWLEDTLADMTDTLNGSITSNATTVTVTDGSLHHVGDVVEIGTEHMWVSSLSGEVLTVTRAFSGTTGASAATAATVTRISVARLGGADASYDRAFSDITAGYNYTQIYQGDFKLSRSANQISQYGIAAEFDYQAAKKVPELSILIEKSFFKGGRNSGSATKPRTSGGLNAFVATNTASLSGDALTLKDLEDKVESCWSYGGKPKLVVCNSRVKRKISDIFEGYVRTSRDESRGGVVISEIETEFGVLSVVMDRWCPSDRLYVLDEEHIGFLTYHPFTQEPLAKTGDSIKGEVVGEFGLVIRNEKAHAMLTSISTTS